MTGNAPTDTAFVRGNLWTTNRLDGTVSQIDPTLGRLVKTVPVGTSPVSITGNEVALWVADSLQGSVVRMNPTTGEVEATVNVGNEPSAIAVGDSVWVTNALDGTVTKISPDTNRVIATVSVGGRPSGVSIAEGVVWVTTDFGGQIVVLDEDTAAVRARVPTGNRPITVDAGTGSTWAGLLPERDVHRGGTLKVVSDFTGSSLDPAATEDAPEVTLLSLLHDGLVGLKRTGGASSLELVPNLATSLPRPTNSGKTYTFELRPGIKYSNGQALIVADVRESIERALALGPSTPLALTSIRGAQHCPNAPEDCDLSESIVTDDDRSTVTFQLSRPNPEFLYGLASFPASVVPSTTPMRAMPQVPSTGAYKVDSFVPGDRVVLSRNPHFQQWSPAARPAGYVDRIEWQMAVDTERAVDLVKNGEADWIGGIQPKLPLMELRTRHGAQLHFYPRPATYFMFMNTRVAPFDDLRVRRALNYAVDRAEVVRLLGGPDQAAITCQIQPPNQPHYEPYCPYTAGGLGRGGWQRPDLAEARRLIARSGTRGMRIEVWALAPLFEDVGRYFVQLLDRLGYGARLVTRSRFGSYFGTIADPSKEIQIGAIGWFLDTPSPAGFFDLYTCAAFDPDPARNFNHSGLCSREVDRLVARAKKAQVIDPASAGAMWARVERALLHLAPVVPLANPNAVDFVSERVGNYTSSPAYGLLLDQVWVE
jgi:YVTN family beta-propeller protein